MGNKDKQNFIWNTIGTTLLSFNSLFFMIVVTRVNGTDSAGVFSFSFSSSCIINVIALYCGRTFQVTDQSELSDNIFIVARLLTSSISILIALAFVVLQQYPIEKSSVFMMLCIVKCLEAISDAFYGIIQKNNELNIVGKSLTFKSIAGLIVFTVVNLVFNNLYLSCFSLIIVNILFLIKYDMLHASCFNELRLLFDSNKIRKLLKDSSHTFMFTLIVLIIINIPRYAIDNQLSNTDQAIYGIISMPATFMMLLGQFILQPVLVKLSHYYKVGDRKKFHIIILKLGAAVIVLLLLILPFAYILGIPLLEFIYKVKLSEYRLMLLLILLGAAFYAISNILLNALITIRCTKEQLFLQLFVLVLSIIISWTFTILFGLKGSIISYALILFLQFVFYLLLYVNQIKKKFSLREITYV